MAIEIPQYCSVSAKNAIVKEIQNSEFRIQNEKILDSINFCSVPPSFCLTTLDNHISLTEQYWQTPELKRN